MPYVPARKLRSEDKCLLNVPSSRLQRFGGRSFSRAAPVKWSNLLDKIRKASNFMTFKTTSKHTFLNLHLNKTRKLLQFYSASNGLRLDFHVFQAFIIMSPLRTQRWGHVALSVSAKCCL